MPAKAKKGDKVRARVHHNGVRSGTAGQVVGVYTGTYYAVNYPGVSGVCYSPDPHVVPADAATPADSPVDVNTSSPSAASWEALLQRVVGAHNEHA